MRREQELKGLLEKYGQGKCNPDEIRLLEDWFVRTGVNTGYDLSDSDVVRMLNALKQSPRFKNSQLTLIKAKSQDWRALVAAAAIAGFILFSWIFIRKELYLKSETGSYVTIQTGQAEVRKIQLPDSSVIWLNARTQLAYRKEFKSNRSVKLIGEATFHVKKDKAHPFTIHTSDGLETKVLGTEFNIRSYRQSHETEVSVLSGRVSVGKIQEAPQRILGKNETLLFNSNKNSWTHEYAAYNVKWISGQWELKGQGLKALTQLLNDQYGVQVHSVNNKLDAIEINANFHKGQQANEIIVTFCMLANCSYRWVNTKNVELY